MPEYAAIVTLTLVVRARGQNEARGRVEAKVDDAIEEITSEDWYTGPIPPEVEYYIERSD